jgi:hypothetical protein
MRKVIERHTQVLPRSLPQASNSACQAGARSGAGASSPSILRERARRTKKLPRQSQTEEEFLSRL